jgi:hypothetical protein
MPCIILRHIHIGTNKNAFSLEFVLFDEITKSVESHVGFLWWEWPWGKPAILPQAIRAETVARPALRYGQPVA